MWSTRRSSQISAKFRVSRQIFEKCSDIKFHDNPFSGVFHADRRADMTKLIAFFAILQKRLKIDLLNVKFDQILVYIAPVIHNSAPFSQIATNITGRSSLANEGQ